MNKAQFASPVTAWFSNAVNNQWHTEMKQEVIHSEPALLKQTRSEPDGHKISRNI